MQLLPTLPAFGTLGVPALGLWGLCLQVLNTYVTLHNITIHMLQLLYITQKCACSRPKLCWLSRYMLHALPVLLRALVLHFSIGLQVAWPCSKNADCGIWYLITFGSKTLRNCECYVFVEANAFESPEYNCMSTDHVSKFQLPSKQYLDHQYRKLSSFLST